MSLPPNLPLASASGGPSLQAGLEAANIPEDRQKPKPTITRSAPASRQHQRLEDLEIAALLHKSDDAGVAGDRLWEQRQLPPLDKAWPGGEAERPLPLQDHIVVRQGVAAVLAGG